MSPKERIIAIRLVERIKQNPEYAKKIGLQTKIYTLPKGKT